MIAIEHFGLVAAQTGLVSSYVGLIAMLMQGFGISVLTSKFSDKNLLRLSTVTLVFTYLILVSIYAFIIILEMLLFRHKTYMPKLEISYI